MFAAAAFGGASLFSDGHVMAAALVACERRRSAKSALALSAKMARERGPAAGILHMEFG